MCVFMSVHVCVEARSQRRCCFSGTIDLEFGDLVSLWCLIWLGLLLSQYQ